MTHYIFGIMFALTGVVATTGVGIPSPWYVNLGAFGMMAVAFLWILRWMMGKFDGHMLRLGDKTSELAHAQRIHSATIIVLQKQLLAHDLTVHGINPSTGADVEERAEGALKKYKELQHALTELQQLVMEPQYPRSPMTRS